MFSAVDLNKWRTRSGDERRVVLEAVAWLGVIRALIALLKFKRIAALFRLTSGESPPDQTSDATIVAHIGWAVRVGAARGPWPAVCLGQALAGMAMLRRRRIPGTLYLGVAAPRDQTATDGPPGDPFLAHAWLRCGETIVTGGDSLEQFTTLAKFVWM